MQQFNESFKQTTFYKKLLPWDKDIIIVYMGGSRCFGTTSEKSDYDVNVIVKEGEFIDELDNWIIKYRDTTAHFYIRPLEDFFSQTGEKLTYYGGLLTLFNIPVENIIYLNPKYREVWQTIYNNRWEIINMMCLEILNKNKSFIEEYSNKDVISAAASRKLYFACIASSLYRKEPLDIELLKTLNKFKHYSYHINLPVLETEKIQRNLQQFIEKTKDISFNKEILTKSLKEKLYKL